MRHLFFHKDGRGRGRSILKERSYYLRLSCQDKLIPADLCGKQVSKKAIVIFPADFNFASPPPTLSQVPVKIKTVRSSVQPLIDKNNLPG